MEHFAGTVDQLVRLLLCTKRCFPHRLHPRQVLITVSTLTIVAKQIAFTFRCFTRATAGRKTGAKAPKQPALPQRVVAPSLNGAFLRIRHWRAFRLQQKDDSPAPVPACSMFTCLFFSHSYIFFPYFHLCVGFFFPLHSSTGTLFCTLQLLLSQSQ